MLPANRKTIFAAAVSLLGEFHSPERATILSVVAVGPQDQGRIVPSYVGHLTEIGELTMGTDVVSFSEVDVHILIPHRKDQLTFMYVDGKLMIGLPEQPITARLKFPEPAPAVPQRESIKTSTKLPHRTALTLHPTSGVAA